MNNFDLNTGVVLEEESAMQVNPMHESRMMPLRSKHLGAKILVADDEPEILMAVAMRLKSAGYDVITAGDGMEATKKALHEGPDLILLDIGMPCGGGHTIAKRLSNTVSTMMTPIIYLTARTAPADRIEAMSLGAADYITKPFSAERLLTSVERALSGNSSMDRKD